MKNNLRFIAKGLMIFIFFLVIFQNNANSQCTGAITIDGTSGNDFSSFWVGGSFIGTIVHVQVDFTIDNIFLIKGCEVIIEPGIKIIVSGGAKLTITDNSGGTSWLHACMSVTTPTMWDGIQIQGSNAVPGNLIINNNTLIEDAERAVFLEPTDFGVYNLNTVKFNKNWINVLVDHSGGGGVPYTGASLIQNCKFYCKDLGGNNANVLITPHLGLRTSKAISVVLQQGTPYIKIGPYNDLDFADILVNNEFAPVEIFDNSLKNSNTAIFNQADCRLKAFHNEIYRSDIGIEGTFNLITLEIAYNHIHDIGLQGIFLYSTTLGNANIYKNTFLTVPDAIVLMDVLSQPIIEINYNEISYSSVLPNSHAITIIETVPMIDGRLRVLDNIITNYEQGIFVSQFDGSLVNGNYVYMPFYYTSNPGYDLFGIRIENSFRIGVKANILSGNVNAICDPWYHGIMIENCDETGIICNLIGDPVTGVASFNKNLWMAGSLNGNAVIGNQFNNEHQYSFYLYFSSLGLGDQGDSYNTSDNEWHGGGANCTTEDVFSEFSHSVAGSYSQFHVRNTPAYMIHNTPNFVGFAPVNNALVSSTFNPNTVCEYLRFSNGNLENSVANGSLFQNNSNESFQWFTNNWFYKLVLNDTLLQTDTLLYSYWTNLNSGNSGALYSLSQSVSDYYSNFISSISNSGITPQSNIEITLANVLDIYITGIVNGNNILTSSQLIYLENIANLCPLSDGPGVYAARNLKNIIARNILNYSAQCISNSNSILRLTDNNTPIGLNTITEYDAGKFIFDSSNDIYNLKLYDVSGRLIKEVNNFNQILDFKYIAPGLYIYNIHSTSEKVFIGKLNISK